MCYITNETWEKAREVQRIEIQAMTIKDSVLSHTLGLVKFLTQEPPSKKDEEKEKDLQTAHDFWNHNELLCRHYVMKFLSDSLYDVHSAKHSSKELW